MLAEKKAAMITTAVYVGPALTMLLAASLLFPLPKFLQGFATGGLLVCLYILLWRTLQDEYFSQLWGAGASTAFVGVLLWTFFLPLGGRFAQDFLDAAPGELPLRWTAVVCLLAFFVGFHTRRLRSAA